MLSRNSSYVLGRKNSYTLHRKNSYTLRQRTLKTNTRGVVTKTAFFFALVFFVFGSAQALSRGDNNTSYNGQNTASQASEVNKSQINGSSNGSSSSSAAISSLLANENYDLSSAKMGIYTGPGDIAGHNNFEGWLGISVPYATDYIDYKGGWTKDFVNSDLWLMKPWGKWVSQGNRRLVLGVPMLESANVGQFDSGINGDFDTYFRDLASELVSNNLGSSVIRLGYEANCNTIGPWQATDNPAGYRLLFRHEVQVMRSVPGAGFAFDWTVCNGLQNGHALNSFDSFYPGDDVVDIVGIDIYDVKWQDTLATPQSRWNYILNRQMGVSELISFARSHAKLTSFPEWGLYGPGDSYAGGGDDPYFIGQMAGLISSTKPFYHAYFNLDWGGGVLSDYPQGQDVFKHIFGQ